MPPPAPLTIPWGDSGTLDLRLPDEWGAVDRVEPDLNGALHDYPAALASALDGGDASGHFLGPLGPGSKVALVVDDPSRWTPVREALPLVLERLTARGVRREDVTLTAGVGRHHALDDAAMRGRVGDAVVDTYPCFSPPVDDLSAYADLGKTPQGVPVRVFRPVAAADLRILIGSVLPHLQAGFGGGYKLIFPGTSHRTTLGALHRQGIGHGGDAARLLGGDASSNPMRRAIRDAAGLLGPCLSVSHLIGAPGEILRVSAGHPDAVQDALAAEARRRFAAPAAAPADVVAAGNFPWPGDPLQSFKVLLQHRGACRPGGVLAGFFWTDPAEMDRSFPLPALRAIAMSGAAGGWAIRRALAAADRLAQASGSAGAFMLHWARELVVDRDVLVYAPPLYDRLGPRLGPVQLFDDPAALWRAAATSLRKRGVDAPSVRLFPKGGLTYAGRAEEGQRAGIDSGSRPPVSKVPPLRTGSEKD